jgi:hypothetical protein
MMKVFAETNEEWKDVVKEECFAFVGILILCGVLKKHKEPDELWAVRSLYYRPVFPASGPFLSNSSLFVLR